MFDDPALARAKSSIVKAMNFKPRERMWIQRELVEKIVEWCEEREEYRRFGYLYLFAYIFLLRLPSEALPAAKGRNSGTSRLFQEGDSLVLELDRRKNRPRGSRLKRSCWCEQSVATCPVHRLGEYLGGQEDGAALFAGIGAAEALATLRHILYVLEIAKSSEYRTHDLRRGHALDLQMSGACACGLQQLSPVSAACWAGAPLYEILSAGEWSSPAFLQYLDYWRLEADVVIQAHVDESDCED